MKCVMIIDNSLPLGLIANTSAVLAISIGDKVKGIVGEDVFDQDGTLHTGITQVSIPMLKGDSPLIRSIRSQLLKTETDDLFFVDFCNVAQRSKDYAHYKKKLHKTPADHLDYLGIAIYGNEAEVNALTGDLSLLR